jgi:peptidoglycan/xylan/chitin deacetylase (PgdA/CDA1 family)
MYALTGAYVIRILNHMSSRFSGLLFVAQKPWLTWLVQGVMVVAVVSLITTVIILSRQLFIAPQRLGTISPPEHAQINQTASDNDPIASLHKWLGGIQPPSIKSSTRLQYIDPKMVRIPILMYHYIRVNPDPRDTVGYGLSVTPDAFVQQMAYLVSHHYHAVSVSQIVESFNHGVSLPDHPVAITFDDGYRDFYTDAYPILKQYGLHGEAYIITSVVDKDRYMTWQMLHEILSSGVVTIGSHTVTHPFLTTLSPAAQINELRLSKQKLESELGVAVNDFCYPFGNYNQLLAKEVLQVGYTNATTTNMGVFQTGDNLAIMPRVRVQGGESLISFINKLR